MPFKGQLGARDAADAWAEALKRHLNVRATSLVARCKWAWANKCLALHNSWCCHVASRTAYLDVVQAVQAFLQLSVRGGAGVVAARAARWRRRGAVGVAGVADWH